MDEALLRRVATGEILRLCSIDPVPALMILLGKLFARPILHKANQFTANLFRPYITS